MGRWTLSLADVAADIAADPAKSKEFAGGVDAGARGWSEAGEKRLGSDEVKPRAGQLRPPGPAALSARLRWGHSDYSPRGLVPQLHLPETRLWGLIACAGCRPLRRDTHTLAPRVRGRVRRLPR